MGDRNITPPAWAERIVGRAIPKLERVTLLSDLEELYALRVSRSGRTRALIWYLSQFAAFPLTRWQFRVSDSVQATTGAARDVRTGDWVQDGRYAVRGFARAPVFTVTAVSTLALGFGAVAAVLSLIGSVLLTPLPYPQAERLVSVDLIATSMTPRPVPQTGHTYLVFRDDSRSFETMGIWAPTEGTVVGPGAPERVPVIWLADDVLGALRVSPALGRAFLPEDAEQGSGTVILSDDYWRTRFGSDPSVLNRTIEVDGQPRQIVGVMPPRFTILDQRADLLLPFALTDQRAGPTISFDYRTIGRLRDGVDIEAAIAEMQSLLPRAVDRFEAITPARLSDLGLRPWARPLKDTVVGQSARTLWLLLGTVAMVLAIALANVANLLVVRSENRSREVAVRRALGASEGRLARQFVVESLVLAATAGALGLGIAVGVIQALIRLAPDALPRKETLGIDLAATALLGIALLGTAVIMAVVAGVGRPSLDVSRRLRSGGRTSGPGRESQRFRSALAVTQISLALTLVIGAGLMIRSVGALRVVDPGFNRPDQVMTFRITIPPSDVSDHAGVADVHRRILDQLKQVPGVTAAGATSGLPLAGRSNQNTIQGRDPAAGGDELRGYYKGVAGDYLQAMGVPLLGGRTLGWDDLTEGRLVGLVNESTARALWGDAQSALGKFIRHDDRDPWREVVGVVGDVRDAGLEREAPPGVYWPIYLEGFLSFPWSVRRSLSYVVRTDQASPLELLPSLREAVWSVNPSLPLAELRTMDGLVDDAAASTSFVTILLGSAALIALLLGLVGTFGVMAHTVNSRLREIGIRLAFGASAQKVRYEVLGRTLRIAGLGILIGIAGAAVLSRFLSSRLYGVSTADPATYGVAALLVAAAAVIAGWVPASRASRVDPIQTLNSD